MKIDVKKIVVYTIMVLFPLGIACASFAAQSGQDKKAIVLASFGTTYPSALVAIMNIEQSVKEAFPGVEVRIAFTSNIIRNIWHGRQKDTRFLAEHKEIPEQVLYVKGPLAAIADLQDEGYRTIIVQPTHLYAGEEYADLCSYVRGLNSIRTIKEKYMPFVKLVMGRPVMGMPGNVYDYHEDLKKAALALANDVALARKDGSALVYMGHGNEYYSTGVYAEFQQVMRETYPGVEIFVGTVEGFPSRRDVLASMKHVGIEKVVLKPLMVVAGDHTLNDMAGEDDDSWKNVFTGAGISVKCIAKGLGETPEWNEIYVEHIRDAAKDNGITL